MERFRKITLYDIIIFIYLMLMNLLIIIFRENLDNWQYYIIVHMIYIVVIGILIYVSRKTENQYITLLRLIYPILSYAFFYKEVDSFMHLIYPGWFDHVITRIEYFIFGFHPTILLQKIALPPVTEYFKMAYFSYFILIPFMPLYFYFTKNYKALNSYITTMTLGLFICYIVFILFPVEGPRYTFSMITKPANINQLLYTKELKGYIFTYMVDFIMEWGSCHGACIPSAHVAAALIILLYVRKYIRKIFPYILIIIISLIVATVYNRYHYISDMITGIIVGYITYILVPIIEQIYNKSRILYL